jgi:hypothetical protein
MIQLSLCDVAISCENSVLMWLLVQCVQKVAVHLQMVSKVMSTSVYTGLNPFNFILKHFLQMRYRCFWEFYSQLLLH